MSDTNKRDKAPNAKTDEARKNEACKSYSGVPVKEPGNAEPVRIDLERQHRGKNGR
jgi:hypothetical protein